MTKSPNKASSAPVWRISGGRRLTPAPFLVAGIVNLTPDSFSDGGRYTETSAALERLRAQVNQGAHIIDLGAESTRPGADAIGHEEEWRRLAPVLQAALEWRASLPCPPTPSPPAFCLSIDTYRAATARDALRLHQSLEPDCPPVDIINDVSGGLFDPDMDRELACYKPGYVLCHSPAKPDVMQRDPRYDNVADTLMRFFEKRMAELAKAGLPEECVALDPGVGFGKTLEHTRDIFTAMERFASLGRPLFLGLSRKSFLGTLSGLPVDARGPATAVAVALSARLGAHVHRVHDVEQAVTALAIARWMP